MKKCDICGVTEETNRIVKLRYSEEYYCEKHRWQIKRHKKITDNSQPEPSKIIYCEVCGESSLNTKVYQNTKYGKTLCRRHSLQMNRHGKILQSTIYERNEFIQHKDFIEVITKDTKGNKTGATYVDIYDFEKIKNHKVYKSKEYARICLENGKKKNLHNFIMECEDGKLVDHINSEYHDGILGTLDNRRSNLRIANNQKNAFNMNKGINKGVKYKKSVNRWYSQIMYNYKGIWLGIYDTKEEAIIARFIADILIFKEFRNNIYDENKIEIFKKLNTDTLKSIKENVLKFLLKKEIDFDISIYDEYINNKITLDKENNV